MYWRKADSSRLASVAVCPEANSKASRLQINKEFPAVYIKAYLDITCYINRCVVCT